MLCRLPDRNGQHRFFRVRPPFSKRSAARHPRQFSGCSQPLRRPALQDVFRLRSLQPQPSRFIFQQRGAGKDKASVPQQEHPVRRLPADQQYVDLPISPPHGEPADLFPFQGTRIPDNLRPLPEPEVRFHALRLHEHIDSPPGRFRPQHRLGGSLLQPDSVQIHFKRQNRIFFRRQADFEIVFLRPGLNPDQVPLPRRHNQMILEIVDKEESALSIRPYGKPQRFGIPRIDPGRALRQHCFHRCEPVPEETGEKMDALQPAVGFPDLAEFPQCCLIVIGNLRHLRFVEVGSVPADGIGSPVEHVVPEEIAARAQLDVGQRVHAPIGVDKPVIIAAHHARAHFAAGVGPILRRIGGGKVVRAFHAVVMIILVDVFLCGRMLSPMGIKDPGPVGISAPQGQHPGGIRCAAPGRSGEEGRNQSAFKRNLPQRQNIFFSVLPLVDPLVRNAGRDLPHGGGMHVFVVQLNGDHGAAVPIEQSLHLFPDLSVQAPHISQKALVALPHLKGFSIQPVRQPSVPDLSVVEGTDPENDIQPMLPAQGNEPPQVPPPGKVKYALFLFDMVPEEVGGYHVDPAHAHFGQFVLPAPGVHPAVVELPGHGIEGLPVFFHVEAVEADAFPCGRVSPKVLPQVKPLSCLILFQIDPVFHGFRSSLLFPLPHFTAFCPVYHSSFLRHD